MFKFSSFAVIFGTVLTLSAAQAEDHLRLDEITADGAWDCVDAGGVAAGTVVIADQTYAFLKPDGRLGGYGTVFKITADLNLPVFAMVSGYMKDVLGSSGFGLRGPKDNPHETSGEIFLNVIMSQGGVGPADWDCNRRGSTP
jgi:hypothetical protein